MDIGLLRARKTMIVACPGKHDCLAHIVLADEEGYIFADAPMDLPMCRKFGEILTRIGCGEDPEEAIEKVYPSRR